MLFGRLMTWRWWCRIWTAGLRSLLWGGWGCLPRPWWPPSWDPNTKCPWTSGVTSNRLRGRSKRRWVHVHDIYPVTYYHGSPNIQKIQFNSLNESPSNHPSLLLLLHLSTKGKGQLRQPSCPCFWPAGYNPSNMSWVMFRCPGSILNRASIVNKIPRYLKCLRRINLSI